MDKNISAVELVASVLVTFEYDSLFGRPFVMHWKILFYLPS